MAEEKVYKKFTRKADEHLSGTVEAKHGKQVNQKIKPYVVLQYKIDVEVFEHDRKIVYLYCKYLLN